MRYRLTDRVIDFRFEKEVHERLVVEMQLTYDRQWEAYQHMLEMKIDKGLVRIVIGTGVYSSAWVTMNMRSIMNFLSLRVHDLRARDVSYPLWEINQVANKIETIVTQLYPRTMEFFQEVGRRAP